MHAIAEPIASFYPRVWIGDVGGVDGILQPRIRPGGG
jgi:hypothetical protein